MAGRVLCAIAVIVIAVLFGAESSVRAQGIGIISEIRVVGSQRIEPATVLSYMSIAPGQPYDEQKVDASLKALFATGLFSDVTLQRDGRALIVQVVENPILNRVAFEGNRRITDEALAAEVTSQARVVYSRTRVQSDVQRVIEVYRRNGRFAATVEPKIIQQPENRVDLVFEINEGPQTNVRTITFIGNEVFSDSRLKDVIVTNESAWWRILTQNDTYDPDRLALDREQLRRFYLAEGYADFRVASAVAELTPDREAFIITFTVEEGQRYKFGEINLTSKLRDLDPAQLTALVAAKQGKFYDSRKVDETVRAITATVGRLGYAFVTVRPSVQRDREALTVSIVFEVQEGPRVYVERIDIVGNERTLDKVIRREVLLEEGDAYDPDAIRRSRQRIVNLNFFNKVEVSQQPGSAPDRAVVTIEVEEKATGELSFGAGYSTAVGPLGDITLRERNLLGRGQDLRLSLTLAQVQQQVDLSFTEPYFLDRDLSVGFDIFRRITNREDQSSFQQDDTGGALRSGYQLSENLRHNIRYSITQQKIANVDANASQVIQDQAGTFIASVISNDLFYDRLDTRLDPTEGYFLSAGVDLAGLGGDVFYTRTTAGAGYFIPFFNRSVSLGFSAEAGYIVPLKDEVRVLDRFFVGGNNLRGFTTSGVGPRDTVTGDAIGGTLSATGTIELSFPLGLPKELGFSGKLFADVGTLTGAVEKGPTLVDSGMARASVGFGLAWRSPFGPLRIDIAKAVVKEDEDKTELFRMNFGTRF
ncbi:MAG: outer membrane protein assembly factor BamA [Alphaproteobacteria bacterium]|nr:outer membrane protein assembly factor BamA [Alphaproteobacteria bacterium]